MSTPADTIFSDPTVQFLQKLLDDFRKGAIILPRFQRPFVWDKQRRLELFDSVRKGIPMGSLMIWEMTSPHGSGQKEDTVIVPKTELGPFRLPPPLEGSSRRFLLDGEQRLMTLYFALHEPKVNEQNGGEESDADQSPASFEVFFDLEELRFITRADLDDEPPAHYFPLRKIFVSRGILSFHRELETKLKKDPSMSPDDQDKKISEYIERTDSITEAVLRYKIPITVLSTDNLEWAAETFKRINSQGVSMNEAHMMNAISWRSSFDLFERFAELRQGIDGYPFWQYGDNLGDDVLLRVAKRILGHDVYDEDVSGIAPRLRDDESILKRVGESMKRCAAFLATRGLHNPAYIPNSMQLIILGRVFDEVKDASDTALNRLEDWLWLTSYTEVFTKVVRGEAYKVYEAQALSAAKGEPIGESARKPIRKPLPRFSFRATRSRALAWLFAQRMMKYDQGEAAMELAKEGSKAMGYIVKPPQKHRDIPESSSLRVLCDPSKLATWRGEMSRGPLDVSPEPFWFEAQGITPEALAALRKMDANNIAHFARLREAHLNRLEEERFVQLCERLFPKSGI